jgi:hypothetical protein
MNLTREALRGASVVWAGNRKAAVSSGFARLRGKDSNLDYLIQSQASYR